MSTERLPFGFNSLIPETYKTKAEAFARCLQHKLLSLGRIDASPDLFSGESSKRLNSENQQDGNGSFSNCLDYSRQNIQIPETNQRDDGLRETDGSSQEDRRDTSQKIVKTEEDSDEEFSWHSESESNNFLEQKKQSNPNLGEETKQKLTSMSSEDSTVDSWCSCQDNLTDFEKFDSENEEANYLASQIKGSPKLRNLNVRLKRKELQEKPWKRNSKKNHSSSTESVDSQFSRQGMKQLTGNQIENFDSEPHPQYILLDGLELEDDEVPYRILRESSSTSNLEVHFPRLDEYDLPRNWWCSKTGRKACEGSLVGADMELLTPPSSPDLERRKLFNGEGKAVFQSPDNEQILAPNNGVSNKPEDLMERLNFAEVATDFDEVKYDETENMEDFTANNIPVPFKKIGGIIVECPSDCDSRSDLEVPEEWISDKPQFVVTIVQVLEDKSVEGELNKSSEALENPSDNLNASKVVEKEDAQIVETEKEEEETNIQKPEDDEILDSQSKLRRCSSLKTWKTPPGTPGAKKIVRFADALGLDLADVRTFLDDIPRIPNSAFEDLHFDFATNTTPLPPPSPTPTLIPLFQQPGLQIDFIERVQQQKICLESALVTDVGVLAVSGYVRVRNISFHKSVHVRYSLNNWETFSDLQATYVPNSCDGFSDRFSFVLYGHTLKIGQKLEFALRLESSGAHYWDNNGGINYAFNCLPQSSANNFFSSPLHNNLSDPWPEFY